MNNIKTEETLYDQFLKYSYKDFEDVFYSKAQGKNIGRNQSLTDTTNYNIKKLKSLFDESYKRVFLSAAEVRKMFGNSKNVIDIFR
ncbi:hypothetical protein [Clostridium sp. CMCC3677]|uniref:hypothetical protein n=1 Tax=Clostridium sp. CMCC3677 TaxID=2949963 RepID=UPI0013F0134C|nr:hypothetical protein [Clostridium sp. CMCC3677]NFG61348.1 hypothetical protein [Clostridium botulinum]NFQ09181.1 hypothetical protein [Clostridium botulinum]